LFSIPNQYAQPAAQAAQEHQHVEIVVHANSILIRVPILDLNLLEFMELEYVVEINTNTKLVIWMNAIMNLEVDSNTILETQQK